MGGQGGSLGGLRGKAQGVHLPGRAVNLDQTLLLVLEARDVALQARQTFLQVGLFGQPVIQRAGQGIGILALILQDEGTLRAQIRTQPLDLLLKELQGVLGLAGAAGGVVGQDARHIFIDDSGGGHGASGVKTQGQQRGLFAARLFVDRGRLAHGVDDVIGGHRLDPGQVGELARNLQQVAACHQPLLDDLQLFQGGGIDGGGGQGIGDLGRFHQQPRGGLVQRRRGDREIGRQPGDRKEDQRDIMQPPQQDRQIKAQIIYHPRLPLVAGAVAGAVSCRISGPGMGPGMGPGRGAGVWAGVWAAKKMLSASTWPRMARLT